MSITSERLVSDIVTTYPGTIPVFEHYGIDYCCGGKQPLVQACEKTGLDLAEVLAAIEAKSSAGAQSTHDLSLAELCRYIVERHHHHERQQFPLIHGLLEKVQRRHGAQHPELFFISELAESLEWDLVEHFSEEERTLFPLIASLEEGSAIPASRALAQPIQQMLTEHEHAGEQLRLLREKTNNYTPPADACTTFRALWKTFHELEIDLHRHVHLENNILFPRALALLNKRM